LNSAREAVADIFQFLENPAIVELLKRDLAVYTGLRCVQITGTTTAP